MNLKNVTKRNFKNFFLNLIQHITKIIMIIMIE